jgi:hypothetical protein
MVDASGLDMGKVIEQIWLSTEYAVFYDKHPEIPLPKFDHVGLKKLMFEGPPKFRLDYFCGKPIKCDVDVESQTLAPVDSSKSALVREIVNAMKRQDGRL